MDDSTSHPLEHPISWDKSMLAKHDTVYRQATLIGSRGFGLHEPQGLATEPHVGNLNHTTLEEASNASLPQSEPYKPSSNLHSTKPDHQQGLVFEHWSNGKPSATIAGSKTNATHKCGVEDCDKAFLRKPDLARHLQTHKSGPRTYDCLAEGCPRRGLKGFWRMDKFKDHMDRKHPEIEFEPYSREYRGFNNIGVYCFGNIVGYRDVEKREQHEALMRSKGYKPHASVSGHFDRMSDAEMAVARLTSLRNDAPW